MSVRLRLSFVVSAVLTLASANAYAVPISYGFTGEESDGTAFYGWFGFDTSDADITCPSPFDCPLVTIHHMEYFASDGVNTVHGFTGDLHPILYSHFDLLIGYLDWFSLGGEGFQLTQHIQYNLGLGQFSSACGAVNAPFGGNQLNWSFVRTPDFVTIKPVCDTPPPFAIGAVNILRVGEFDGRLTSFGGAPVPEPPTLSLLALGSVWIGRRVRRLRRKE